jgi:hypothetical protein
MAAPSVVSLIADGLNVAGSICLAIPLFRDLRRREDETFLQRVKARTRQAADIVASIKNSGAVEIVWRRSDLAWAQIGVCLLISGFALGPLTALLRWLLA